MFLKTISRVHALDVKNYQNSPLLRWLFGLVNKLTYGHTLFDKLGKGLNISAVTTISIYAVYVLTQNKT